ncbi:MAG: hypothetical protein AB7E47_13635 [Desulfovibrionaceae bacterium]
MDYTKGYTKAQMWDSIERLASISHSVTSNDQRLVHKSYESVKTVSMQDLEPPRQVNVQPVVEQDSGHIVSEVG